MNKIINKYNTQATHSYNIVICIDDIFFLYVIQEVFLLYVFVFSMTTLWPLNPPDTKF